MNILLGITTTIYLLIYKFIFYIDSKHKLTNTCVTITIRSCYGNCKFQHTFNYSETICDMVESYAGKKMTLTDSINTIDSHRKDLQNIYYWNDVHGMLTKLNKDTLMTLKDVMYAYKCKKLSKIVDILTTLTNLILLFYVARSFSAAIVTGNLILILMTAVLLVYQSIITFIFSRESEGVRFTIHGNIPTKILLPELKTQPRDFAYATFE